MIELIIKGNKYKVQIIQYKHNAMFWLDATNGTRECINYSYIAEKWYITVLDTAIVLNEEEFIKTLKAQLKPFKVSQ
jgi:hypothetical protein